MHPRQNLVLCFRIASKCFVNKLIFPPLGMAYNHSLLKLKISELLKCINVRIFDFRASFKKDF